MTSFKPARGSVNTVETSGRRSLLPGQGMGGTHPDVN